MAGRKSSTKSRCSARHASSKASYYTRPRCCDALLAILTLKLRRRAKILLRARVIPKIAVGDAHVLEGVEAQGRGVDDVPLSQLQCLFVICDGLARIALALFHKTGMGIDERIRRVQSGRGAEMCGRRLFISLQLQDRAKLVFRVIVPLRHCNCVGPQ